MVNLRKILAILLLTTIIVGAFAGCSTEPNNSLHSMDDFSKGKIGVLTGSIFDQYAKEYLPEADRFYFINTTDLALSLRQEKIDGILLDMAFYTPLSWEYDEISFIEMDLPDTEYAVAFPKTAEGEALKKQIDAFIHSRTESGWIAKLAEKWFSGYEPDGSIDLSLLTGENGTLRVASTVDTKPFDYLKDGQVVGFDVDFLFEFAMEYGYALQIDTMDFGALLPGLAAERYDLAVSGFTITDERKEAVLFSEPYYFSPSVMAVLNHNTPAVTERTLADFTDAKIAVITGSARENTVKEVFPNAERVYFYNVADAVLAVEQGKVDAYVEDAPYVIPMIWEGRSLKILDENLGLMHNGFVFPQGEVSKDLREKVNAFLSVAKTDGTIDRLYKKWMGETEPTDIPDYASLSGENGTIRLAISVDNKPILYQRGSNYTGFEIELLTLFGQQAGYAFEFEVVPFESIIAGISSGKYDMGASGLNITPEREESVDFSESYASFGAALVYKGEEKLQLTENEKTLADFENAKIGIMTGSSHDGTAKEIFPEAERVYFNTVADMVLAVEQEKIDGYIEDEPFLTSVLWEGSNVKRLDEGIKQVSNGFAFPQSEDSRVLREQVNEFISASKADGTMDALLKKWLSGVEPAEHPDYTSLSEENGTIRLAVTVENKPAVYLKDSLCTGFEMELLTRFAQQYGYNFEIETVPFGSVIAGIASGKYEMAAASLNITDEREESVDFSDPYALFDVVMVVKDSGAQKSGKKLADFENAKIGIHTGSIYDIYAKEHFPDAELMYYNLLSDMMVALDQGKIDGFISETTYITGAIWEGAKIKSVEEPIAYTNAAYVFQKGEASAQLQEQLNAFIRKSKENGTIDKHREKWLGETEPTETLDYQSLTGENGTIRVAVAPDVKPITYMKDGEPTGYEIELLTMFAKEYGYKLDISYMSFDAVLPGVTSGKYDIGTGAITITEERAESLDFSESHLTDDVIMVVKAEDDTSAATNDFWSGVKESFEKTFIREDRWKLIVEGVGVTMLISICAGITGSLLGFGLYMLSRSDRKFLRELARGFAKVYSRIIAGTPVVVILMILFYVVFGKFRDMSGIVVAIIGFTLTFGAFVYDHMTVSVGSVDHGQTEAAYALGYTKNQTFFRIIFPQAMTVFLPSYCGQAVELIKATAVVGYVAVNDLTKMGDIIRSNTYEAFFPLIATAVIYFLLTWMLSLLLGFLKRHFEPKRRSKEDILKGVKTV